MKITSLNIDGFGHFADREFGPFDQPVTVMYGPNEAGKTTLLEFLRVILFGFLDGRSRRNLYEPLAGGRHGGSLTILGDSGESVVVRRVQGSRGGRVTLTTAAGEPIPESDLPGLLGNHNRSSFEKIFAFTIDDLHDDALLSDETVNSQIYSAGMGASNLPSALDALDRRKRDLFLVGGSLHKIYNVAGLLDKVESDLTEVANNSAEYSRETTRLEQVEHSLAELRERSLEVESAVRYQQDLQRAWDFWNDLAIAQRRLEDLPQIVDFPANGVSSLETLSARAKDARAAMEEALAQVSRLQEDAAQPIEHESIIDSSDDIRDLERRRAAFDGSVKDVPERQAELVALQAALSDTLSDLGPDWDAERLTKFDLSLVVREEVSTYGSRLRAARGDLSRADSALEASEASLEEATQAVERAQTTLHNAPEPALSESDLRDRRIVLRRARSALDERNRFTDHLADLHAQLDEQPTESPQRIDTPRFGAAVLAAVGITLAVFALFQGAEAAIIGTPAGLILLGVAWYLFRNSLTTSPAADRAGSYISRQIEEQERRISEIDAQLDHEAQILGLERIDMDALIVAEDSLDVEQGRLNEWSRLSAALQDAREILDQRTHRHDESSVAVEAARDALESAESDWNQWLEERGLVSSFSPENIEVLRGLVDLGRTRYADVTSMENRIAAIQTDIGEFLDILQPLVTAHGVDLPEGDHARAAAVADHLIGLYADVSEKSRVRAVAVAGLREARANLSERERRLRGVEEEISALLEVADAADKDDFLRRSEIHDERENLRTKITASLDQLQRISGPGDALDALQGDLATTNPPALADNIRRSETALAEISEQIESMVSERTTIQNTLSGLLSEEDSSRLRTEHLRLIEQMRGYAREWTVLTLAENLLKEAQAKFERERQPGVIRESERFFGSITEGRYRTVYSPLGTSEIHVTDDNGAQKQPNQLSRGTREQLFLSLRFGLVREAGQQRETLPVIVDEALINFDPARALRAACAFIELAQTNQVLVFTCHPWMVELFQTAASESGAPGPGVVKIG